MISIIAITLVLRLGMVLGGNIYIPSGNASSFELYMCNGSLTSGTTLILGTGTHLVSPGLPCYLTNLSNIAIVASHNATVQCAGERMFSIRGMQNFTIKNVTFAGCGQLTTMRVRSKDIVTSTVAFFMESSLNVSMRGVTIKHFKGFAVVGYALSNFIMSDVKISGCANNNCSGVYLESASDTVTFERCEFRNLIFDASYHGYVPEYFGPAITLLGLHARVHNSDFISNQGGSAVSAMKSSIEIFNTSFTGNHANWGGAIRSYDSLLLYVSSCTFRDNHADRSGGAIYQGPVSKGISSFHCTKSVPQQTVTIDSSSFSNNTANVGGAIFAFNLQSYVQVIIRDSTISNNTACLGAAIYAGNRHKPDSGMTFSVVMEDTTVIDNYRSSACSAWGGAIYLNEVDYINITGLSCSGSEFVGNTPDGAIQAIGTNVHLYGNVSFRGNQGVKGGALYLTSNAQLYFYENCNVEFTGNIVTVFGGAIYIQGDRNINVASSKILLSCSIHFIANNHNVNISFSGNHAQKSGHSVYATPIYDCQLEEGQDVFHDVTNKTSVYGEYFTILPAQGDSVQSQIMSFPVKVQLCNCDGDLKDMVDHMHIAAWPGATIRCYATTVDFVNHTSPSVVYTTVQTEDSLDFAYTQLGLQQGVQWFEQECTPLVYQIYGIENTTVYFYLSTDEGDTSQSSLNIIVTLGYCGPGFMLSNDTSGLQTCACSNFLASFGVSCDVNLGTVNRTDTIGWIGLFQNEAEAVATTCPLDYCNSKDRAIDLEKPNRICNGGREGILCGRCPDGQSVVFGSTECHICSDLWLINIGMFAVMGVVLIMILFILNLTVTQGTIYSLIFYANIIVVNSTIFFGGLNLKFLQIIISFIILDLGFPLCFYNGMDDAAKMGFQFVFPIYLFVLILIFVMVCRYCISPRRQDGPSKKCVLLLVGLRNFTLQRAVSVLATLIYLSYFKLVRAAIDILSYTTINVQNGASVQVWFYDGNILYLHGVHIVLFIFAIAACIFFIIPYTLVLSVIPIIDRFSDNSRLLNWINVKVNLLKPMNDAYYAPYKGWCRSWLGLQLLLFIFLIVPSPILGSNKPSLLLFIHVLMLSFFVFVHVQIKPFGGVLTTNPNRKCKGLNLLSIVHNWLDLFYLINYTLLAFAVSYLLSHGSSTAQLQMVVGLMVGIALLVFFLTIVFHMVVLCHKLFSTFHQNTIKIKSAICSPEDSSDETRKSLTISVMKLESSDIREPLLESGIN